MEITIAASALLQEITLPMNSLQKEAADGKREQKLFPRLGMAGQNLRGCILQNCISVHPESEIWLASDEFHQSVACLLYTSQDGRRSSSWSILSDTLNSSVRVTIVVSRRLRSIYRISFCGILCCFLRTVKYK